MEIVLNKTSFLDVPIQVEPMHGVTFSNENKGHKFIVSCMRGGELLTLTGTVTARFMRANNTTILIAGNDYTGIVDGKAVVTLPQDCYNVPGRFQMAIFLTADGATSCIYACVGSVQRTQNGDLIDSGEAVPSLDELLAQIDACEQATVDATAAANAVPGLVAETFATNKAYTAGSYVYYNGSLYRFTADHAAGAWTGSDVTAVKLANDVGELKSALAQDESIIYNKFGYTTYLTGWVQGYIRDDGTVGAATKKCRTNFKNFNTCEYARFTPKAGYILDIAKYTSNTPDTFIGFVIKGTTDSIVVNVGDGNYYCFIVSNTSNTAITPESLPSDVVAFDKLSALYSAVETEISDKYKQLSTEIYYKDDALDNTLYSPKSSAFLTTWLREYIRPDGTIGVSTKLCRTNFKNFTNSKYYRFTPQDGYHLTIIKYTSNTQASFVEFIISQTVRPIVLDVHEGYYCFVVGKVSNEEILTTEADTAVQYSPLALNFVEVTEEVIPKISEISSANMCLAGIQTVLQDNALPYAKGYLFHEFTEDRIGRKLYFGNSLDKLQYIGDNIGHDPFRHNYAISPTDGSIIVVVIANNKTQIRVIKDNTYTNTDFEVQMSWLYNSGVDFIKDTTTGTEYCVFAEYGANPGGNMYVYRGKYPYTAKTDWSIVKTVIGEQDIHHFHMVRRDPWTNILYLTSGDADNLAHWWYSTDCGATWTLLANGSDQASTWGTMACRTINFIFTKDYIYWATDSYQNHMLCRIQRNSSTGVIDLSTFEKLTDLKPGCATNSLCYSEAPHGLFMYERVDSGATAYYGTPVTMQFYSLDTNTLEDVLTLGLTADTWGGSRGKCYINYTNPNQPYPAMGFDGATPCIFDLVYDDPSKIGTIVYDVKGKTVKDVLL